MSAHSSQSSIKVLHVTFDMRIGGTEMVIKNIIEGNQNSNIEMSIFCIEEPLGPWGQDLMSKGVTVDSVARKDGFDLSVIKRLRQHIKQHQIDVLHCHQYTPWVYATLASVATNSRLIFTEHGRFYPDSSSWKRRYVNPLLASLTHRITAISQATKQALVDYEFLRGSKISVIYNGITSLETNTDEVKVLRKKMGLHEEDIVFGTIARLDPIKNHTMMIRAFAKVNKTIPNTKLIVVGDGELMQTFRDLCNLLAISKDVIFTGYIPYPKDYLSLFDVFLLSSLSEGTSMTLLEAMSLHKPCIATDAGGNKEIVAHGENGLITPNDDENAFAAAMLQLVQNKHLMEKYGRASRARFENLFSVAEMSKHYSECYGA